MTNRCTLILCFQFTLTLVVAVFVGVSILLGKLDPAMGFAIIGPAIAIWLPSPMVDNHLDHLVQSVLNPNTVNIPVHPGTVESDINVSPSPSHVVIHD